MKWHKQGLVYGADGTRAWAKHSALQPTPFFLNEDVIRVLVGFRDEQGVSRVGYVDVNANNPSQVIKVSANPVLDVGIPGAFDENGVVPCAVVRRDDGRLYLYYAGYQLGQKVKFYVFSGLAISENGGESFIRHSRVPVCDRTDDELFFRVIHSIRFENGVWRVWYGGGGEYTESGGKQMPNYDIRYVESADGLTLGTDSRVCLGTRGDEYRVGRPYVIEEGGLYRMFYSSGTAAQGYRLAYAESPNGISWTRKDEEVGIDVSASGWDAEMQCYPSVVRHKDKVYLFYNGNNYGRDGFGYAILEHW